MVNAPPLSTSRILFVTGRLAEPSLRAILQQSAPGLGIAWDVAVLPISVAALMTPAWVERQLEVPAGFDRVVIPGHCRGDLSSLEARAGVPVARGPEDVRDLPRFLGGEDQRPAGYGAFDIEILAEINHASRLGPDRLIVEAEVLHRDGADVIDLGCDPASRWDDIGVAVAELVARGFRVSVDSFDASEVEMAIAAGAELVLSVNATNRAAAVDWGVEVVVVPDEPHTLEGLRDSYEFLSARGVSCRLDPVLDPIGFGFAASLGRYLEVRGQLPEARMLMGVGNLTELTDVDSAGVNAVVTGFCQEVGITSVLTTQVINWARTSVRELDVARRLMRHAVHHRVLPKRLETGLVQLRDPRPHVHGPDALAELAARVRDPNWRIFAEDGRLVAINGSHFLMDDDPFRLFDRMEVTDPSHAFYLGHELMKATTALTLGKNYRQDQALDWGFLTRPEISHRARPRRGTTKSPEPERIDPEDAT